MEIALTLMRLTQTLSRNVKRKNQLEKQWNEKIFEFNRARMESKRLSEAEKKKNGSRSIFQTNVYFFFKLISTFRSNEIEYLTRLNQHWYIGFSL